MSSFYIWSEAEHVIGLMNKNHALQWPHACQYLSLFTCWRNNFTAKEPRVNPLICAIVAFHVHTIHHPPLITKLLSFPLLFHP